VWRSRHVARRRFRILESTHTLSNTYIHVRQGISLFAVIMRDDIAYRAIIVRTMIADNDARDGGDAILFVTTGRVGCVSRTATPVT